MRITLLVLVILHAFIHLMFVGQALRWFENRPGSTWPDGAALLSFLSVGAVRAFAVVSIGLTATAMIVGSVGMMLGGDWGTQFVIVSAILVSAAHAILWNGNWRTAHDQGLFGVIINAAIITIVLLSK